MNNSLPRAVGDVISAERSTRPRMAKAGLRKTDAHVYWVVLGRAVERTRTLSQLSLKEFAAALDRDERQIARWIEGTEQTQVAVIFAVALFRAPFVIALAEEVGDGVEVVTHITLRRPA